MPVSIPPAADLLGAVRDYLDAEVLPGLHDDKWFNVKIAINVLALIERELRLGAQADSEDRTRLESLTRAHGSLDELTARLALAIREGAIAWDDPALLDHLRRTTADALRINNPKWLTG